ncbi:MAG: endonuclease V [Nitrospirae bacterium]|nr:endonuclease V [Nitrospirota bacterium]MBF0533387.1 endonuclease V [Nitrospirota bacterium]MBF0616087.1 endonuclease V [Nitrospirota bacterium]
MKTVETGRYRHQLAEAAALQIELSKSIILQPFKGTLRYIAGVDAAFIDDTIIAAACLYEFTSDEEISKKHLQKTDEKTVLRNVEFPYIPGFLSFREAPAMIDALRALITPPDIILVDGQGIAHPRGFGLASHIGVLMGLPTVGSAKSRLIGNYIEPDTVKGSTSELLTGTKKVGTVLRSRNNVKPLFISPGHLVDFNDSVRIVLDCTTNYRLPQPIRCAHNLAAVRKVKGLKKS